MHYIPYDTSICLKSLVPKIDSGSCWGTTDTIVLLRLQHSVGDLQY